MIKTKIVLAIVLLAFGISFATQGFAYISLPPEETLKKEDSKKVVKEEVLKLAPLNMTDLFYYDFEKNKVYPQISLRKFAVVSKEESSLSDMKKAFSKLIKDNHLDAAFTILEDADVPKNTTVFEIFAEMDERQILSVMNFFKDLEIVWFVSPIFIFDGIENIFSGSFRLKEKSAADDSSLDYKDRLHVKKFKQDLYDKNSINNDINHSEYKIKLRPGGMNFLQIINFFAQDPMVIFATPLFNRINPLVYVFQEVDFRGAKIGSRIPYKITVIRDSRVRIDPSSLTNLQITQEEVVHKLNPYNFKNLEKGNELIVTGYIQFFIPGTNTIPPRKIAYIFEREGNIVKEEIESNAVTVQIASLVPEGDDVNFIVTPSVKDYNAEGIEDDVRKEINLWFMALIPASLAFVLSLFMLLKGFFTRSVVEEEEEDTVSKAFDAFKTAIDSNSDSDYASNVDAAVREFISAKTGLDFSTGIASSIKARLEEADEEDLATPLEDLLVKCEHVISMNPSDSSLSQQISDLKNSASQLVSDIESSN